VPLFNVEQSVIILIVIALIVVAPFILIVGHYLVIYIEYFQQLNLVLVNLPFISQELITLVVLNVWAVTYEILLVNFYEIIKQMLHKFVEIS